MSVPLDRGASRGFRMTRTIPPLAVLVPFALLLLFARPETGRCSLYLEFLVDRSGSIWAPLDGAPKAELIADALEEAIRKLPADISMGLRVYPPPDAGGVPEDPGLRIALGTGNRDRFPAELDGLNPRGKAPLLEHVEKALADFPDGPNRKLLLVITDGADNDGTSFCVQQIRSLRPEDLRFQVFSIDLQDAEKRAELDCLARLFSGASAHLTSGNELRDGVLAVGREAHRQEMERQARMLEEQRREALLNSRTRLQVSFQNTLDPFFADSLEVVELRLDGQPIPVDPTPSLGSGERAVIFEGPVPEGSHRLDLRYAMRRGDDLASGRPGSLDILVEEGKTSYVLGRPKSALFHWGCTLHPEEP